MRGHGVLRVAAAGRRDLVTRPRPCREGGGQQSALVAALSPSFTYSSLSPLHMGDLHRAQAQGVAVVHTTWQSARCRPAAHACMCCRRQQERARAPADPRQTTAAKAERLGAPPSCRHVAGAPRPLLQSLSPAVFPQRSVHVVRPAVRWSAGGMLRQCGAKARAPPSSVRVRRSFRLHIYSTLYKLRNLHRGIRA